MELRRGPTQGRMSIERLDRRRRTSKVPLSNDTCSRGAGTAPEESLRRVYGFWALSKRVPNKQKTQRFWVVRRTTLRDTRANKTTRMAR